MLVTDIDAELGLITCVWSRIGQMARHSTRIGVAQGCLLIPVSGVDDAKSDVREQVGEESPKKRMRWNTHKRHDQRWNDFAHTQNRLALEPNVTQEVLMRTMFACLRTVKCCSRVHALCYWPSAKHTKKKSARLQMEADLRSTLTTIETLSLANMFLTLF